MIKVGSSMRGKRTVSKPANQLQFHYLYMINSVPSIQNATHLGYIYIYVLNMLLSDPVIFFAVYGVQNNLAPNTLGVTSATTTASTGNNT